MRKFFCSFSFYGQDLSCSRYNSKQKSFSSNVLSFKNPSSSNFFFRLLQIFRFVRNQKETFPNNSGKTVVISSGDAYREPMFLLKLNGKTRDNIRFGADLMLNSLYKGPSSDFTSTNSKSWTQFININ